MHHLQLSGKKLLELMLRWWHCNLWRTIQIMQIHCRLSGYLIKNSPKSTTTTSTMINGIFMTMLKAMVVVVAV